MSQVRRCPLQVKLAGFIDNHPYLFSRVSFCLITRLQSVSIVDPIGIVSKSLKKHASPVVISRPESPQMWDRMWDANSCLARNFWKNFLRQGGTAKNQIHALLFKCHASGSLKATAGMTLKHFCLSVTTLA